MRIMGLDISTKSIGWCILDDGKLIEYGMINPSSKMSLNQKLYLFYVELEKLIVKYKPDEIAVEDVVFVVSIKVAKILARFSAIPILHAYNLLKKDVHLYEPSKWKSFLVDCDGSAKKCEVQLSICKQFNILSEEKITQYNQKINESKSVLLTVDRKELNKMKSKLKSLKAKKENCKKEIHGLVETIKNETDRINSFIKSSKKIIETEMDDIDLQLYTETGISNDIADSIGVALALHKEFENVEG